MSASVDLINNIVGKIEIAIGIAIEIVTKGNPVGKIHGTKTQKLMEPSNSISIPMKSSPNRSTGRSFFAPVLLNVLFAKLGKYKFQISV